MKKSKEHYILKTKENNKIYSKALVGSYFSNDFRHYAEGYYQAANILVNELKNRMENPANTLVYPICFLYRHYIEIALKGIIEQHIKLGHYGKRKTSHPIMPLFNIVRNLRKKHDNSDFSEEIIQIIEEFHELDRSSQGFRYPFNIEGELFFPEHDVFDLGTLKENMELVEGELYGIAEELKEEIHTANSFI